MAKKPKRQPTRSDRIAGAVIVGVIVIVIVVVAATHKSGNSSSSGGASKQAIRFINKEKQDIRAVQVDVQEIQAEMQTLANAPDTSDITALAITLAADAKTAHDELTSLKTNFAVAGDGTGKIEDYEASLYGAVNTLKNAMGTVVTLTNDGGAGTAGTLQDQLTSGISEWNSNLIALYSAAHLADAPTI